jgi:catalase
MKMTVIITPNQGFLYSKAMNAEDRDNLIQNIVGSMKGITGPKKDEIINRQLCHFSAPTLSLA